MAEKLLQNRFAVAPTYTDIKRSQFNIPHNHKTTFNFSRLVPFYWQECLPGDSWQVSTQALIRMSTPLTPVLDNAFVDFFYFFVPNRLVWSHWAEFLGENKLSAWINNVDYIIPHAVVKPDRGSLLDYLGLPIYTSVDENGRIQNDSPQIDAAFLLPRSYWLIWNEWFRDQNVMDPILINTGDSVTNDESLRATLKSSLCKVSKFHDQFTSALPSPQKGDAVDIPLGDWIPVTTKDASGVGGSVIYDVDSSISNGSWLIQGLVKDGEQGLANLGLRQQTNGTVKKGTIGAPLNLVADTSAAAVSINNLRQAFQMQRLLELQARSGTRYTEIIRSSFSVISPDARLQRPEYLGGCRVNVQMQQVAQTSSTDAESPLGHVAAYSKTVSSNRDFSYSCTEHGFIIGVMCARTAHTYQQGVHKMWSRRGRYDFYWPTFAHIGEQPIRTMELYCQPNVAYNHPDSRDQIFGYQEAWYEYRFKPNQVTSGFRSTVTDNLDEWHYADYFESRPYLSKSFIEETDRNVDRTLAVTSDIHDQLIADINVHALATRPMPVYSVPGLIDHF